MGAGRAWRVGPTCALAALVALHAWIQLSCVLSASLALTLTPLAAALALGLGLVASAAFASRFTDVVAHDAATLGSRSRGLGSAIGWLAAAVALTWAATVWARLWLLAAARPSYDWDGLYYHIPAIHEWVLAGRVTWIDALPDVPFVNYPMGVEAQTFFLHRLADLSLLVDACNLWYWPMAALSIVVLADRLGARGAWRWLAGALVVGAPAMVCQGVTSYTDPASAACVMAAIATSVLFVFGDDRRRGWAAVLWGASLGLVLGAKGTGLPTSAALGLGVAAAMAWRARRSRPTAWVPALATGAVVALLVGGYWYARNAYHTGNPVHPVQVRFGARVLLEGYDAARFTDNNQPAWLAEYPPILRAPVSWLQLDAPIEGYAPIGGLGYLWPVFGLPAVLVAAVAAARRRRGVAVAEIGFTLGLAALLLAVQPAAWWARFVLWLHVVGLSCFAVALTRASSSPNALTRGLSVACGLAALALGAWESERTLGIEQARGRVAGPAGSPAVYLTTQQLLFPGIAEWDAFDRFLAAEAIGRSPWGRAGTLIGGILSTPLGQRRIHVLPVDVDDQDLTRLDEAGVTWVIWDVTGAGGVPQILAEGALDQSVYAPSTDVNFRLIRLDTTGR